MKSDPIPNVNMMIFMKKRLNIGQSIALASATAITIMIAITVYISVNYFLTLLHLQGLQSKHFFPDITKLVLNKPS